MGKRLRVVIHGGMHKTGTSSLQRLLADNRRALLEEGISFPEVGGTHHSLLSVKRADWQPAACFEAIKQAQRDRVDSVIFSSEVVSTQSSEQLKRLTACFSEHDLTYVLCFRNWQEYLPSRWSQNCSRRDSQPLHAYVRAVTQASGHADYRFDFVLNRVLASGPCRVVAVSYDNAVVEDGSVIPTVLRAAGLTQQQVQKLQTASVWDNARIDPALIELCRLMNGIVAHRRQLPQDDLCRSVEEHRPCREFFDLIPTIALLDASLRLRLLAAIEERGENTLVFPDTRKVLDAFDDGYGHLFANLIDGRIFAVQSSPEVKYSPLLWNDFRTDIPGVVDLSVF